LFGVHASNGTRNAMDLMPYAYLFYTLCIGVLRASDRRAPLFTLPIAIPDKALGPC
jgi:hypothetical protein